jgi:elongation factor G
VIEIEVAPANEADREQLLAALGEFAKADARLAFRTTGNVGIAIAGIDERELDRTLEALRDAHGIEIVVGSPQVAYRETITRSATIDYAHKQQRGGTGQYARVKIVCEPLPAGAGCRFESRIVGGNVPKEYVPGAETGIESVLVAGVLAGFPVIDLKVVLVDGAYHEADSSTLAFEIAARFALREALVQAGPVLLEPVLKVEITTPMAFADAITRDLRPRRATIQDHTTGSGDEITLTSLVPAANMLGYATALRSISQDRASYVVSFGHYAPVSPDPPFRSAAAMRA